VALLVLVAGLLLWKVPEWQVASERTRLAAASDLSTSDRLLLEKELFQAENGARGTLALILGAAGLLLGLGLVWRRFETNREAQSQERLTQAVEQLASERVDGSPRTETRLGGIYALERIAAESAAEYWPVMEVLTAYLRENALRSLAATPEGSAQVRPGADVQAIIGVLGRRHADAPAGERRLLDLRGTDLRGANLSGARLEGVVFQGARLDAADATGAALSRANLREANLSTAALSGADLQGTALSRANLEGARLNGADLRGADLSGATLRGADLWQANLRGCNLKDADLRGADLSQADLQEAILWRADLSDASLTGAHLRETHLERAKLSGAGGLTWEQGKDAFTDDNTILPDYLIGHPTRPAVPQRPLPAEEPPARSRVVIRTKASSPRAPGPRKVSPPPAAPAANVVQLQEAVRAPAREAEPEPEPEPEPEAEPKRGGKKLARPRRRHPALVAPPRSAPSRSA
jgi:uncharacterized protein YjbI with pentapeptide repeats